MNPTANTETELAFTPLPALAPATSKAHHNLTQTQKILIGVVAGGALLIAGLGFIGSYSAVVDLAKEKHFGKFAHAFPLGIDAGIGVFLALDLLLTWLRMPYPLLRQMAWGLTGATIAFNAATAWGDDLAVGMHASIPVLFVVVVEAARHAIGRIADITADKHIESPPPIRWLLSPVSTFRIWRRMRLWHLPSYLDVIGREREIKVFRAQLRTDHGRRWRRAAPASKLLALKLARVGIPIAEALAMPAKEEAARQLADAENEARRAEAEKHKRAAETAAEVERLNAIAAAADRAAVAERAAMQAAQERERAETDAKRAAEAREVAERRAETRRDRDRETTETTRRETKRNQADETDNVATIGDRETETARLLALMRDRKDPMKVSLDDAIRETGRPKSTAAKRLSAARDLYLAETG